MYTVYCIPVYDHSEQVESARSYRYSSARMGVGEALGRVRARPDFDLLLSDVYHPQAHGKEMISWSLRCDCTIGELKQEVLQRLGVHMGGFLHRGEWRRTLGGRGMLAPPAWLLANEPKGIKELKCLVET